MPPPAVSSPPDSPPPSLGERLPAEPTRDADQALERFLGWVGDLGFELYPAQEEALLELYSGRHVVLDTPTGSGKSLVALGLHFKGLCEGRRSYYTSPIKALASEKLFALCDELGPERVGMLTGDASINPSAPVVCCTAEVLANMALRDAGFDAPYVVMDEFHYYSDPARGVAWQVPLVMLPATRFLMMSATLGNTAPIAERLERRTAVPVATVRGAERPVPLEFDYRETSIHRTLDQLLAEERAPVYVVNFTQRECAELAQSLTSTAAADRDERKALRRAVGHFRFDTPYGKELRRLVGFGVGVHHAGLLPKYRLLVEQLSQQGRLKLICGTDTLGVGVNVPIRTVLFRKLAKYDGRKVGILSVREFHQIAGRAGRKGFDERGWVVAQAPEHVVEKKQAAKKGKKKPRARGPAKGEVSWDRETFDSLVRKPPETLRSQFRVDQGMVLNLLQRDADANDPERGNFASLRELIAGCHESEGRKQRLVAEAARLVLSLYRAGIVRLERDRRSGYWWVSVEEELQREFSMHQPLSLYLVESLELLDEGSPEHALDLLSVVESILENPRPVLFAQRHQRKSELVARLKAEGVGYEERMARLDEVSWPQPRREFAEESFRRFRQRHPWVRGESVRPKSIGREIYEQYWSFGDFVRRYGLARSEGVLLRYLSQLYKTLAHNVPEAVKTEPVYDLEAFFRTLLERTDTSLLEEWESLLHPELRSRRDEEREAARRALRSYELFHDPRAFAARVRAELHQVVRALAAGDWQQAAEAVRQDPADPWPAERFEEALAPFVAEYGEPVFSAAARLAHHTRVEAAGARRWLVEQTLLDPAGDGLWRLAGTVDLSAGQPLEGPLVTLREIGP